MRSSIIALLIVGSLALYGGATWGDPGDRDVLYKPDLGPAPVVRYIAADSAGRMVLSQGWGVTLARLLPDGRYDSTFVALASLSGISQIACSPDGGIFVIFQRIGSTHSELARLLADGNADTNFLAQLAGETELLTIAPDGDDRVICYVSRLSPGADSPGLLRLTAQGNADPSFKPVSVTGVAGFMATPEKKLLIWGRFERINGTARTGIGRLEPDGELDLSFNPSQARFGELPGHIAAGAPLASGKVLIGGQFNSVGETPRLNLARLNSDGSLDPAFDPETALAEWPLGVQWIGVQHDGKILAGMATADSRVASLIRFYSDGQRDTGYALVTPAASAQDPVLLPDDSVVLNSGNMAVVRVLGGDLPDGPPQIVQQPLDTGGTEAQAAAFRVRLRSMPPASCRWQRDGRDIPGATSTSLTLTNLTFADGGAYAALASNDFGVATSRWALLQVRPVPLLSGQVDLTFHPAAGIPPGASIKAMAPQGERVLLGGDFLSYGTNQAAYVARIDSEGGYDDTFSLIPGPDGPVDTLLVDPIGSIYVGGRFQKVNDETRPGLARLAPNGGLDQDYVPQLTAGSEVRCLLAVPGGRLLAAGAVPPRRRPLLAMIASDQTVDPAFNLDPRFPGESVWAAALQADGRILAAGPLPPTGAQGGYIVRIHPNGSLDATFASPALAGAVQRILVLPDETLLLGLAAPVPVSLIGVANPVPTTLVRLHSNGAFHQGSPAVLSAPVTALQQDSSGRLLAGTTGGAFRMPLGELSSGQFSTLTDGEVNSFVTQRDGRILMGGAFRHVNEIPRPGIARLFGEDGVPRPVLKVRFTLGPTLEVSFLTNPTNNYLLEGTDALEQPWAELASVIGDGTWKVLTDPGSTRPRRYYRLRVE